MNKIYIIDEISKTAAEALVTASRKGYAGVMEDWLQHIDNITVAQAFTKTELRNHLRDVIYHLKEAVTPNLQNLRLKDARIVAGQFEDLDSTNLSHAGVYYAIVIELPEFVKLWLEQEQETFTYKEIKQKKFDLLNPPVNS